MEARWWRLGVSMAGGWGGDGGLEASLTRMDGLWLGLLAICMALSVPLATCTSHSNMLDVDELGMIHSKPLP
jgi:hypothetical protein